MPQLEDTTPLPSTRDPLASFREEIEAIPMADILVPRVDVAGAALTAIGSMPEIEQHRAAIVARFGEAGGRTLDRLVPIARGLIEAHALHLAIVERDLEPMAAELLEARTRLFTAASVIIERGIVHKKSLDRLEGGQSYQGRVLDTILLANFFESQASAIGSRTTVTAEECRRAHDLAKAFSTSFAERDQARTGSSQSARDRGRMFTLFFRTYERVRQMLTFLRWHEDDVDEIAPSLFAGRRTHRKDDGEDVVAPLPANDIAPGMPGSNPFHS